jgi:hypothetical protein
MRARFAVLAVLATAVVTTGPFPVLADPPPWAPAHGYRKKDRGGEVVVVRPRRRDCGGIDNQFVGSTAGAAGGAALGNVLGGRNPDDRLVGSVAGAAGGALLGGLAGQSADHSRGC